MKSINKDILREISKTKSKFISIMIIMFLGVFIFVGLKETSPAMVNTYNKYIERHKMYDLRVSHNFGINEEDMKIINALDNVDLSESYFIKKLQITNSNEFVNIESLPEKLVLPKITEGTLPSSDQEIALVESLQSSYKIGDEISFISDKSESNTLKQYKFKVVGFVQGADHIEVSNNNLANKDYFGYVKRDVFKFENVSGVNLKLKNINYKYSDKDYITEVNKTRDSLIEKLKIQQKIDEKNYLEKNNKKLNENYGIEDGEVYYINRKIEGADAKTFEVFEDDEYAKDKKNIYYGEFLNYFMSNNGNFFEISKEIIELNKNDKRNLKTGFYKLQKFEDIQEKTPKEYLANIQSLYMINAGNQDEEEKDTYIDFIQKIFLKGFMTYLANNGRLSLIYIGSDEETNTSLAEKKQEFDKFLKKYEQNNNIEIPHEINEFVREIKLGNILKYTERLNMFYLILKKLDCILL